MNILGINDTITDSGISYCKNENLILAINEERFTRKKGQGGFPKKCLNYFIEEYKSELSNLDAIVFSGILTPTIITRIFPGLVEIDKYEVRRKSKFFSFFLDMFEYKFKINTKLGSEKIIIKKIATRLSEKILRKRLPKKIRKKKIYFVDHHFSHAAAAFYSSPFNDSLVFTLDGSGDGCSGNFFLFNNEKHKRLLKIDALDSLGLFYSLVTVFLGYREHRHEGKITGLAAYGNSKKVKEKFPFVLKKGVVLSYKGQYGANGLRWLEDYFSDYRPEDIAAWLQENTEKIICEIIRRFINKTGRNNICLSGGVFANVKVNQKIKELKEIKEVYVYPAMSDAGISHGAICAKTKKKQKIKNIFLGNCFNEEEVEKILKKKKIRYKKVLKIEERVAEMLTRGKIVARFVGKMEYGPRALGNRSILAPATSQKINNILNKKLKRNDFMPFAPAIMEDFIDQCVENEKKASVSSEFMTVSFKVKNSFIKNCPAVVHVDGTTRAQKVIQKNNPGLYKILEKYHKLTGIPAIINTSFNVHEEPIVMNPEQAIDSFLRIGIDALAIENFIVEKEENIYF